MSGRLMPRASYAATLSDEETASLAALTDDQKLAVAHSIRLVVREQRQRYAALLDALEALVADMRHEDNHLVGWQWIDDRLADLLRPHRMMTKETD